MERTLCIMTISTVAPPSLIERETDTMKVEYSSASHEHLCRSPYGHLRFDIGAGVHS